MKFNQVSKEQIEQASEAIETIRQLKRMLAAQRLSHKAFSKYFFEQKLATITT